MRHQGVMTSFQEGDTDRQTEWEWRYDSLDAGTEEWLGRCAVWRLRESGEVESLQAQLGIFGIPVRVGHVVVSMCILSFLDPQARDEWIAGYVVRFKGWLVDAQPWGILDLAKGNRFWFRFTGVPLFLWHEAFLKSLGSELGDLLKVADRTKSRRDLSDLWLMIDLWYSDEVLTELKICSGKGEFHIGVRLYRHEDVPVWVLRPVMGMNWYVWTLWMASRRW